MSKDRVDTISKIARDMGDDLAVTRDVEAGYSQVKKQTTKYLPQHPSEDPDNYSIRLNRPAFFNAFARTTGGLTGMVFRRNPVLGEDVHDDVRNHWENIDNAGTHGDVFVKQVFHDAMVAGHAGILVDFPDDTAPDKATEKVRGLRPSWRHISKENMISWRTEVVAGRLVLTQLVLFEPTILPDGDYGEKYVNRYRVFRLVGGVVSWALFEVGDMGGDPMSLGGGEMVGVTAIPFVPVYANHTGFLQSKPPLMDLAWLVIAHYQTNSDMLHAAHIANTPVPVFIGVAVEDKVVLGSNTVITIENPEGDAKWLETAGGAINTTKAILVDMRTEMSVLGLGILERRPMTAETATAKRIDRSEKDSQLGAAARSLEDGIETALGFHAQFMGMADENGDGGSVLLNRDYQELTLTPEQIRVYSDVVRERQLSPETLWDILTEGNALPSNFNADEELTRINELPPGPFVAGGLPVVTRTEELT
jgi:hypothetical protein